METAGGVSADLKAPFPYFGGKSRVTDIVWRAFGPEVNNYVEPFCGSLAMLLGRPGGAGKIETVNDAACAIANFWRAITAEPTAVAKWCDRPVNECDMHAIHVWLVGRLSEIQEQLRTDPDFFDAQVAGWWVWGACIWIGGGWCGGVKRGLPRPNLNTGQGVQAGTIAQRPQLSHDNGVHAYSPGRRPTVIPTGVHLPSVGNDRGINGVAAPPTLDWFSLLAERLRRVRVCCGDWSRIVTPSVLGKGKNVGGRRPCAVFLDPPYAHDIRDPYLYNEDDPAVSAQVREWAIANGDDPELRIALCGFDGEHEMPPTWREHKWIGARGYSAAGNPNRERERIWFSPHCLPLEQQAGLFGSVA